MLTTQRCEPRGEVGHPAVDSDRAQARRLVRIIDRPDVHLETHAVCCGDQLRRGERLPHERRRDLEGVAARREPVEPFLDANIDEGSLSDHAGVACELTLQPPMRR